MKKIGIVLPSLRGGGAERSMLTLANALSNRDFIVDLILVKKEGVYVADVDATVNVVDLNKSRVLHAFFPLLRYINKSKPDYVITAMPHVNIVTYFSILFAKHAPKLIVSERNYQPKVYGFKQKLYLFWLRKIMRFVYMRSHAVASVSQMVSDQLTHQLGVAAEKVITIYNPVVNDRLLHQMKEPPNHKWLLNKNVPVILAAGSLSKQKGFCTLIKAFSLVRKYVQTRLIILGEGKERSRLQSLILNLGLKDDVDLPGFIKNPFPIMKHANVFVLSSRWEGLPGVLIQAMACGTPVISTDCPGGSREILEDGKWGELVPVDDTEQMAASMMHVLNRKKHPNVIERAFDFHENVFVKRFTDLVLGS